MALKTTFEAEVVSRLTIKMYLFQDALRAKLAESCPPQTYTGNCYSSPGDCNKCWQKWFVENEVK